MNRITRISIEAEKSLEKTKSQLLYQGPKELKRDYDIISKKLSKITVESINSISNFEVFILFINIFNDDQYPYDETMKYALEFKDTINSWTYEKCKTSLELLYESTIVDGAIADPSCLIHVSNLGIPPIFLEYKMKFIYKILLAFLKLKSDLNKYITNSVLAPKDKGKRIIVIEQSGKQKIIKKNLTANDIYTMTEFKGYIDIADQYIKDEIEKYEFTHSALQKRKKYTEELLRQIDKGQLEGITTIPSVWHQYLDIPVLEEIYYLIQDNLFLENRDLDRQIRELSGIINKTSLTSLLYSKGISPQTIDKETLSHLESIPDIEKRIETLLSYGLSFSDIFSKYIKCLELLDEENIKLFSTLINQKALTVKTLRDTIITILESKKSTITTNYEILSSIMDFSSLFYKDSILLISSKELRNRISVLKEYKLSKNNYIFLLCNYEFLGIYDLLIENEIEEELLISICETGNPLNTIKRILIYRSIGEEYQTVNHLLKKEVTSEMRFACPDAELDEYLLNITPSLVLDPIKGTTITTIVENPLVKSLDETYRIDNVYMIGDAIISRPKFLRNFESKKGKEPYLISSLISKSILDDATYYSLFNELRVNSLKK